MNNTFFSHSLLLAISIPLSLASVQTLVCGEFKKNVGCHQLAEKTSSPNCFENVQYQEGTMHITPVHSQKTGKKTTDLVIYNKETEVQAVHIKALFKFGKHDEKQEDVPVRYAWLDVDKESGCFYFINQPRTVYLFALSVPCKK